jgi:hypothetical protein
MQMMEDKQNLNILKFDIKTGLFLQNNNFIEGFCMVLIVMTQTLIFDWEPQK